jgi:acetyltransferase-like isoleucine patch superfamily enzyme
MIVTSTGRHVVRCDDTQLGQRVRIGHHVVFHPGVTVGDDCTIMDGAVLGRPPLSTGNLNRPTTSGSRPLIIGAGSIIGANAVLYHGSRLGERVLIGDLASVREGCVLADNVVIGRGVLVMYDTHIGQGSRVIDGAILTGAMTIEHDVFIGPGVRTVNDNDVYLKRFGLLPFSVQGPIIRALAVVGTGANIAAGVEIGRGALVAPQAMVTRNVPPWTVVAGVPARVVRPIDADIRAQVLGHFKLDTLTEAAA